jgi:hypothetical protein
VARSSRWPQLPTQRISTAQDAAKDGGLPAPFADSHTRSQSFPQAFADRRCHSLPQQCVCQLCAFFSPASRQLSRGSWLRRARASSSRRGWAAVASAEIWMMVLAGFTQSRGGTSECDVMVPIMAAAIVVRAHADMHHQYSLSHRHGALLISEHRAPTERQLAIEHACVLASNTFTPGLPLQCLDFNTS